LNLKKKTLTKDHRSSKLLDDADIIHQGVFTTLLMQYSSD